jgi:hypothetical protein
MEGNYENRECAVHLQGTRKGKYIHTNPRHVLVNGLTFVQEADVAYVEEVRLITFVV